MSIFLQEWDGKLLTVREHELDHVVVASDKRVCRGGETSKHARAKENTVQIQVLKLKKDNNMKRVGWGVD